MTDWKMYGEKALGLTLFTAVLLFSCATSQTIPPETICISLQDTSNITYMCSNDSFPVLWQVGSTQIRGSLVDMFEENGVLVTSSPFVNGSITNITFTQQGIEYLFNILGEVGFPVNCLVEVDLLELDPIQRRTVFIYSTTPPPPVDLTITPTDRPLQYLLEWTRPQGLQDCEPINYRVTVTNLVTNQTVNDTIVPGGRQRELMLVFSDMDSEQCQLHEFSVTSFNDIGESEAAVITETLPISPNVSAVSSSLTAVPVLTDGVQIEVTFQPASSCNETRYPVVDYTISITGLDGSIDVPHTGQDIVASLTSGVFPGLQEDTYSVLVMACADFACQPADPVTVVTNHVQNANLTFLNTTVSLVCVFADTSPAIGCRFQLELSNDNIETVDLERTMDGGVASQGCAITQNMREAYVNFRVAAIISDDSVGQYITTPEVFVTDDPAVISPCELPTPEVMTEVVEESTLSDAEVAAIIIAGLVVFALVIIVIVIIVWWRWQAIKNVYRDWVHHLTEEDGIEFVMDETPEKPTIMMLMKNLVPSSSTTTQPKKKRTLVKEVSHQPDMAVNREEEKVALKSRDEEPSSPSTCSSKDPVACIKVKKDSAEPNSLQLLLKPATLAHVVKVWKSKLNHGDEMLLYWKEDEEDVDDDEPYYVDPEDSV